MPQIIPSLISVSGHRKYLDKMERQKFIESIANSSKAERVFCLTLIWTGCRLSEALELTSDSISSSESCVIVRSLKKRGLIVYRRIPVPASYIKEINEYCRTLPKGECLFPWKRTQAWSIVKRQMVAIGVSGVRASPRGLRHTFGVHAIQSNVPLHLLQKWLGHSKLKTTVIYLDLVTSAELDVAKRMW